VNQPQNIEQRMTIVEVRTCKRAIRHLAEEILEESGIVIGRFVIQV